MNSPKVNNVFSPIFASLPKNRIKHPRLSYAEFAAQISQLLIIPNSRVALSTHVSEKKIHLRLTIDYKRGENPKIKTSDPHFLAERMFRLGIEQVVLYSGIKKEQILNLIAEIDPTSIDTSNQLINTLKQKYLRHNLITIKFKKEAKRKKDETLPIFSASEAVAREEVNKKIAEALLTGSAELKDLILQEKETLEKITSETKSKMDEWIERTNDIIEKYVHEIGNEGIKDSQKHNLFKRLEARKRKIQELAGIKIDEVEIPSTHRRD